MDKFTKTTEIDIPNTNPVEDEAPRKSKSGKIVAAIVCILLAIIAWIYVVETDDTMVEKEFNNIDVVILGDSDYYTFKADKVSVTLVGTNSELVDVDPSKIVVKVDALSKQGKGDVFTVETNLLFYEGEEEVTIKEKLINVLITREEKDKK